MAAFVSRYATYVACLVWSGLILEWEVSVMAKVGFTVVSPAFSPSVNRCPVARAGWGWAGGLTKRRLVYSSILLDSRGSTDVDPDDVQL